MTMPGKDFLKNHVLSWRRKMYSDWEDARSSDRAFQVFGPATRKARLIAWPVAPEDDCCSQDEATVCREDCVYWHERSEVQRSAIPDEQLHTNCRRCWSSASAVRQSAEVDRSARYRLNNFGRRCFAVAGPSTWNSLSVIWQSLRPSTESQHV